MRQTILRLVSAADRAAKWLPPTLSRLVLGWVFLTSGWGKVQNLDKVVEFFTSLGIPAPAVQAPFVAGLELVGGVLLLVGLATRFISLPLLGTMVVALLTARWPEVAAWDDPLSFIEFTYGMLLVGLACTGAGPLSLDHLLARERRSGEQAAAGNAQDLAVHEA